MKGKVKALWYAFVIFTMSCLIASDAIMTFVFWTEWVDHRGVTLYETNLGIAQLEFTISLVALVWGIFLAKRLIDWVEKK